MNCCSAWGRWFRVLLPRLSAVVAVVLATCLTTSAGEPITLTRDGRQKRDPVFLGPSGDQLIYAILEKPTQLRLMKWDRATQESAPLHPNETRSEFEPAASVDGRYLAFVQNRGNLSLALVVRDLMEVKQYEVPPAGGFAGPHSPAIAPDHSQVLFSFPDQGRQHLYAVTIQAAEQRRVVDSVGINNWPCYSPNGKEVVFSSTRDGNYDLYVMNSDGANVRRLTDHSHQDLRPKYSPDGRQIAFVSNRDGNYQIYLMRADGTGLKRLTQHVEHDNYPTWHPDGRRLVIVREQGGRHDLVELSVESSP